jgi:hypothetical protein
MPEWLSILGAGALGALVSTLLTEGGFMAPTTFTDERGYRRWHPGTAGDLIVGAVAGLVFWGLYTPDPRFDSVASVRPVVGSLLAGLGGGRVLAGYLDRFLQQASLTSLAAAMERTADAEREAIGDD